jgi:soluble lytic murein transglycosylase
METRVAEPSTPPRANSIVSALVAPSPPVAPTMPVATAAPEASAPTVEQVRDLVRRRQFLDANAALQGLDLPGIAGDYSKARLALENGRHAEAIERYRALTVHTELEPLVTPEHRRAIARSGAVAALDARSRLRVDSEDWLLAAERLLSEARYDEAGLVIAEASKRSLGSGRALVRLHAARASWAMAKELRFRALVDWRWLVVHAPESPEAQIAKERLAATFPDSRLSRKDWDTLIDELADEGQVTLVAEALAERVPKPNEAEVAHFVGWAHYRARNYEPAARLLGEASRAGGPNAVSDAYHAGQALSRMGMQDQAIANYDRVRTLGPRSPLAALAALRIPREHAFAGRWEEAAKGYSDFLDDHPKHEHSETAQRERAVARYAGGDFERAAYEFKRARYLRPASSLAELYRHLEALSLLATPRAEEAFALFEETAKKRPLSFEGLVARRRLEELARPLPPLDVTPTTAQPVALPEAVAALESSGWFEEAERLLTKAEPTLRSRSEQARFEGECAAYGQLFAGRRRLLVGLSAGAAHAFSSNPTTAPGWVWSCLYPEPFPDWVNAGTAEFQVPKSLVYAIMRQESGFRLGAISSANAHGLMQIIPPTALEIGQALGEVPEGENEVRFDDPSRNVRYGIYYLGMLQRTFGGHPALTAAGYNAGPAAVSLWFGAGQVLPLEMFVAQIPFDETRTYVMRVLSNLAAYQLLDPALGKIDIPLELR